MSYLITEAVEIGKVVCDMCGEVQWEGERPRDDGIGVEVPPMFTPPTWEPWMRPPRMEACRRCFVAYLREVAASLERDGGFPLPQRHDSGEWLSNLQGTDRHRTASSGSVIDD